jgi:hypothetical protein
VLAPSSSSAVTFRRRHLKAAITTSLIRLRKSPSKSPLNPTQNTPSQIAVLDQGDATVLSEENGKFIKPKIEGGKLNGLFFVAQRVSTRMPILSKNELQQPNPS